jgi:hypothetical protein
MTISKKVILSLLILAMMSIVFFYFYSSVDDSLVSKTSESNGPSLELINDSSNALDKNDNKSIAEVKDQSYKIEKKEINISDIGETLYQSVVSDKVVDGVALAAIMTSSVYRDIVKELPNYTNKESDTVEYENRISDYINKSDVNPLLSDYDVACNNDVCFGYFASESKDELDSFFTEFIRGPSTPTHKSGYVNSMEVYNSDTGIFEYRVSFNSNPEVKSITVPR